MRDYAYSATKRRYALARYRRGRAYLNTVKDQPCADCGIQYPPYVMQFDHRGDDKVSEVTKMASWTKSRTDEEIAKCDVVCSNCHAERTHRRLLAGQESNLRLTVSKTVA